ncbi:MAG: hypothetical protein M1822_002944 [Bathelium mastoideum]|nr:MAG: hypothetical protein M1822_002944 [Bathelium mastoideum]
MGSLVISDVVSHFPHQQGIFGGESHHSHHPASDQDHYRAAAPFASTDHLRTRPSAASDVSMTDSNPRAGGSSYPPQHQGNVAAPEHLTAQPQHASQNIRSSPQSSANPASHAASSAQHALSRDAASGTSSVPSPARSTRSVIDSTPSTPNRIKVRDLAHIQSFATEDADAFAPGSSRGSQGLDDVPPQYEISSMPVTDIIEMVAGLLTKITTTNDRQHEHLHRQIPPVEGTAGLGQQTTSVLAFHGKNVPSITILSYLARIHKYCPTTYEVFLSLLVYFDRMTERVNAGPMQSLRQMNQQAFERNAALGQRSESSASSATPRPPSQNPPAPATATPPSTGGAEAEKPQEMDPTNPSQSPTPPSSGGPSPEIDPCNLSHFFVVDSFNIHRLVIAGVTCASKFFSDIFYTNSRYAKVGGLPLVELNHLELQFLLLNDFRLAIPAEEMEAYGTMLVEFYAREVIAQRQGRRAMEGMYPAS